MSEWSMKEQQNCNSKKVALFKAAAVYWLWWKLQLALHIYTLSVAIYCAIWARVVLRLY